MKLSAKKGGFAIKSGETARLAPKNYGIKTRHAFIGVRGTEFVGQLGANENIGCTVGEIEVQSSGKSYAIKKGRQLNIIESFMKP